MPSQSQRKLNEMYESKMFDDFDSHKQSEQNRRQETKRELQHLLTQYLGREGIRY